MLKNFGTYLKFLPQVNHTCNMNVQCFGSKVIAKV